MVVERFARNVNARVLKFYVATGFFGISIFFVMNTHIFTPLEIVIGIIFTTIILKAISNIMLSLVVLFFNLENKKGELDVDFHIHKIDELLSEVANQKVQESDKKASR